jgi:ABC-2 type transport system permease protein
MKARNVSAVFRKELAGYFASPVGYVFIIFYLLISNGFFFFIQDFFQAGQATMRGYFTVLPWVFLFFVPAISMRLWSEEKKSGTIELLLSLPLRESEVVLGKFLAGLSFLAIALACSLTIPVSIGLIGRPDFGVIAASYAAALLLGAAYLAVGLWISSLTENQVVAFIVSVAVLFALLTVGFLPPYLGTLGPLVAVCDYLSLLTHFQSVIRGVLDSHDVVYYASVVTLFLYLNVKNVESRKWR